MQMTRKELLKQIDDLRHEIARQTQTIHDLECHYGDMADLVVEVLADYDATEQVAPVTIALCRETQARHRRPYPGDNGIRFEPLPKNPS